MTPSPAEPQLALEEIHVWRVDLANTGEELGGLLNEDERARGERMLDADARLLWMRSRGVLRALLASYVKRGPETLSFTTGPHGKPALASGEISFNLSHSGAIALYAIAPRAEVGVDVQLAGRPIDETALAKRFLPPPEARRLQGLDPEARRREFLRAWVRHEAALKCRGTGFSGAGPPEADGAEAALWITDLDVGADGAGALACETAPRRVCCWEW